MNKWIILLLTLCLMEGAWTRVSFFPIKKHSLPASFIFEDDLDFDLLDVAIQRQLDSYNSIQQSPEEDQNQEPIPYEVKELLHESLLLFRSYIKEAKDCLFLARNSVERRQCFKNFSLKIKEKFDLYVPNLTPRDPRYGDREPVKFTAYYSPRLEGSLFPTTEYQYPVYAMPEGPLSRAHDRVAIDFDQALARKGLELFYVKDLFDIYIMHIEGGGSVVLPNGDQIFLSYAGTNRKAFRFISQYMMRKGMISNPSVEAQRHFLDRNPVRWREVYSYCPSYVYFKPTTTPPLGVDNIPLTDGRSLAQDNRYYRQKGLIAFVQAERPVRTMKKGENLPDGIRLKSFSRFFIDQDTGGAIRGKARADLYFGFGEEARLAAHYLNNPGKIYYLIKKP